ncbi:hypothetical protein M434DRAFT_36753 [Hypoxylon sp. CO27-5]|nr:hypothetical protein M434DRAFT_36753 [Hypoxylon sp. CO27-5]
MDSNAPSPASSTAGNPSKLSVIWGVVFLAEYKAKVSGKSTRDIYEERKSARKGKVKSQAQDDEKPDAENAENAENAEEPGGNNGDELFKCVSELNIDEDITKIMLPNGREWEVPPPGKGVYKFFIKADNPQPEGAPKAKADRPKAPRVSVATDMGWAPIAHTAQPYPDDLDQREGVAEHAVGPAGKSPRLICDLDRDIFIFDRAVLSSVQRPDHTEVGGEIKPVDIYKACANPRSRKARSVVEEFLLRPKNVALNINDPGSILMYYDLIIRASQSEKPQIKSLLEDGTRTITFFSGPEMCNHKDCNEWRQKHRGMRPTGTLNIRGYRWWMFGDFCLRDESTLSFRDVSHTLDVTMLQALTPAVIGQVRTWSHALLDHNPINGNLSAEGLPQTALRVVRLPGLLGLLIDNYGCMTDERVEDDAMRNVISAHIDPNVRECAFCKQRGFGLEHFSLGPLPKAQDSGVMYLHYQEDEEDEEDEEETDALKGSDKVNSAAPAAPASAKGKGKGTPAARTRGTRASSSKGKGKDVDATEAESESEQEVRAPWGRRARARITKRKRADTTSSEEDDEEPETPKGKKPQSKTPKRLLTLPEEQLLPFSDASLKRHLPEIFSGSPPPITFVTDKTGFI